MKTEANNQKVLVTGASGFIASHCIDQLLRQGYAVRGTLRTMSRADSLRSALAARGANSQQLEFVYADLMDDDCWAAATADCTYVLHIASPVAAAEPKDENEMILPARDGTLRVLRAAAAAGVKRTIYTSSTDVISPGQRRYDRVFDEEDWSDEKANIGAYARGKLLAERAAWAFANSAEAGGMELAVILPTLVLGPLIDDSDMAPSAAFIRLLMSGEYPAVANLHLQIVDVRDLAAAHITAMTSPEAAGQRYICMGHMAWYPEMADTLAAEFYERGYKVPTRRMPDFVMRLLALINPPARRFMYRLSTEVRFSNAKIKEDLNWQPRPLDETLIEAGNSLIKHGFV